MRYSLLLASMVSTGCFGQRDNNAVQERPSRELNFREGITIEGRARETPAREGRGPSGSIGGEKNSGQKSQPNAPVELNNSAPPPPPSDISVDALKQIKSALQAANALQAFSNLDALLSGVDTNWPKPDEVRRNLSDAKAEVVSRIAFGAAHDLNEKISVERLQGNDTKHLARELQFWSSFDVSISNTFNLKSVIEKVDFESVRITAGILKVHPNITFRHAKGKTFEIGADIYLLEPLITDQTNYSLATKRHIDSFDKYSFKCGSDVCNTSDPGFMFEKKLSISSLGFNVRGLYLIQVRLWTQVGGSRVDLDKYISLIVSYDSGEVVSKRVTVFSTTER